MDCPYKNERPSRSFRDKDAGCISCHIRNNFRHHYCCLLECGEHEFYKGCRVNIIRPESRTFKGLDLKI